ncbi:MAG: biopolymer transporter ExbD [Opitutus sp.]|nr:biopolymer transporter ExbD [Opitutus sp.]
MARTFRRKHTQHPISELNVTNLIDLGFTLLIIFMIATTVTHQEQKVSLDLPIESKRTQPKPDPSDRFESIIIRANGSYSMGGRQLTLGQLSRELASFSGQPKPPIFRIESDATATMQQFISLKDVLEKHNLSRIAIITRTKD